MNAQLHEEFKFRCNMCASSFNQDALLKKHMQRHIDGRYHQCPECSKGFTLKNQLNKHIQLEHASSEAARLLNKKRTSTIAGKHNCYFDNCDAFFETADLLNTHLNNVHGLALIKSQNAGMANNGNSSGGGGGKSSKKQQQAHHQQQQQQEKMQIMFTEQLKNIKEEHQQQQQSLHQQQVPLSLPLGISLPLPPFNHQVRHRKSNAISKSTFGQNKTFLLFHCRHISNT